MHPSFGDILGQLSVADAKQSLENSQECAVSKANKKKEGIKS
jgi:hypothetical protein